MNTYFDLGTFNAWLDRDMSFQTLVNSLSSKKELDGTKLILGARFFDLTYVDAYNKFKANRYFIDALGVELLLSKEHIEQLASNLSTISLALTGISWDSFADLLILKYKSHSESTSPSEASKLNESQLHFLDHHGYLVVPNAVPIDLCEKLYEVTIAIAEHEAAVGEGYIYGSGRLRRIYHLLGRHKVYEEVIQNPLTHNVMARMFHRETFHEKYFLTSFHANILYPGAEAQIWHIDANVPEPIPPWIIRANSNVALRDYTAENGATEIIPGSHRWQRKPTACEALANDYSSLPLCAAKGSMIFWHGSLWHRSGANSSNNCRIALLGAYAASHLREMCLEENPYLATSPSVSANFSSMTKRILGWDHGLKL